MIYTETSRCRSCHSDRLDSVLDFGELFVSDFLPAGKDGVRAPLHVIRCADCGLVQLRHTVDRDILFRRNYFYRSGVNESMRAALSDVADHAMRLVDLKPGDHVLDIGANDGTLLDFYPNSVESWAYEPSGADMVRQPNNLSRMFWPEHADDCPQFKVITSIATFYAADDPNAYVAAIKKHLAPDGVWIVQMQDAENVLRDQAVDYFCHEHLCLWDWPSFDGLLRRNGLRIDEFDTQRNDVNGGSTRFVIRPRIDGEMIRSRPIAHNQPSLEAWTAFASDASYTRQTSYDTLYGLAGIDREILYGVAASTKANTVLQWYGIDRSLMPAIIDRSPEKWGLETVGTRIPIISEAEAASRHYDVAVALAWHFLEGLRQRDPTHPFLTLLPKVQMFAPLEARVPA